MTGRRGFSLVEMVIVMVLAGIVSTAAITMFSTQNRLNATMTALGESQENARSAVQVASAELRSATGGAVVTARGDRLVLRMPLVVGMICGQVNPQIKAIYFPLGGQPVDLDVDVDGYAYRATTGEWNSGYRVRRSDGFRGQASRVQCSSQGNGSAGTDADYATLRVGGEVGNAVMLYREVSYYFAPSGLDGTRRAFFRARGSEAVELAQGFSTGTRFEYQLADTTWRTSLLAPDIPRVKAIRLVAEVVGEGVSGSATGSATFSLSREIRLRNTQ